MSKEKEGRGKEWVRQVCIETPLSLIKCYQEVFNRKSIIIQPETNVLN